MDGCSTIHRPTRSCPSKAKRHKKTKPKERAADRVSSLGAVRCISRAAAAQRRHHPGNACGLSRWRARRDRQGDEEPAGDIPEAHTASTRTCRRNAIASGGYILPVLREAMCGSIFTICLRRLAMPCGKSTGQSWLFRRDSKNLSSSKKRRVILNEPPAHCRIDNAIIWLLNINTVPALTCPPTFGSRGSQATLPDEREARVMR